MSAEQRMVNDESGMSGYRQNMAGSENGRDSGYAHSPFTTHYSVFCTRRRQAAFSLVEILIALFVFLIGILGVLAMFPPAMTSAARSMGQVRANILSESALAQLNVDCRVAYYAGFVNGATTTAAVLGAKGTPAWLDDQWNGYFVTLTSGSGRNQSRLIVDTNTPDTITVCPDWNPTPADGDSFIIARMGLPAYLNDTVADTSTVSTIYAENAQWNSNDYDGYYVTVFGTDTDACRRIQTTTAPNILAVTPNFDAGTSFSDSDSLVISRVPCVTLPSGSVTGVPGGNTLPTDASGMDDEWNDFYVRILSHDAAGQCRRINDSTGGGTLTVDPSWTVTPTDTDSYVIIAPPRYGHIRDIGTNSAQEGTNNRINAGIASGEDVVPLCWTAGWYESPVSSGTCPLDSTISTLEVTPADAALAQVGQLIVITSDPESSPAAGQVRLITDITATALQVYPPWYKDPDDVLADYVPKSGDTYEIRKRPGYFLVITTGRAAGRIFPITGYSSDTVNGDTITCAGVNFEDIGVTSAARYNSDIGDYDYKLRNATGFMIVGNDSVLSTVIRHKGRGALPPPPSGAGWKEDYGYLQNSFGVPSGGEPQTGIDYYYQGDSDSETSAYSSVCVFGDSGSLAGGPVQVHTFVFWNFNRTKDLFDNRKPVGFLAGHVGRP